MNLAVNDRSKAMGLEVRVEVVVMVKLLQTMQWSRSPAGFGCWLFDMIGEFLEFLKFKVSLVLVGSVEVGLACVDCVALSFSSPPFEDYLGSSPSDVLSQFFLLLTVVEIWRFKNSD